MAVHRSVIKRQRQTGIRKARNQVTRTQLKTLLKKARADQQLPDAQAAKDSVASVTSALDRAAGKGRIPKNRAARLISRLHTPSRSPETIPANPPEKVSVPQPPQAP